MSFQAKLHLGESQPIELSVREEAWLGPPQVPSREAAFDVARAARAALESPLGFPPLAQSMVPGDQIAIALGSDVPAVEKVVRGVVEALEAAGASRQSIVAVVGSAEEAKQLSQALADLAADGFRIATHDPADEAGLCYLAAVDEQPLLVNRQLFEADVVIPVACARHPRTRDYRGVYDAVFPRFSDILTLRKFAQGDALDTQNGSTRRREATDQAGWLLGAPLVMQVVPGRGAAVAAVLAGAPEDTLRAANEQCEKVWTLPVAERADLVVVSLSGGPQEQTWDNVARALFAAAQAADEQAGAVAVCTQLDVPPGETLQKLIATNGDLERAARLGDQQTPDAAVAWELYKSLCRGPVYFMSQLDPEVVEDLGMAPLDSHAELARLTARSATCVVIDESQHAAPMVQGSL